MIKYEFHQMAILSEEAKAIQVIETQMREDRSRRLRANTRKDTDTGGQPAAGGVPEDERAIQRQPFRVSGPLAGTEEKRVPCSDGVRRQFSKEVRTTRRHHSQLYGEVGSEADVKSEDAANIDGLFLSLYDLKHNGSTMKRITERVAVAEQNSVRSTERDVVLQGDKKSSSCPNKPLQPCDVSASFGYLFLKNHRSSWNVENRPCL